jgi:uridine kinase
MSDCPILLLTGLSGSGKTYIGQNLKEKTKAILISLDALKFYDSADKQSRQFIDEFKRLYPEIIPLISIQWSKTDEKNTNDFKYTEYCCKFFNFIYEKSKNGQSLYIVEGIQIFVRIPWEQIKDFPTIIIGTSGLRSFYNTYKRDYVTKQKPMKLSLIWHEFKLYHNVQRKIINRFIKFLSYCPTNKLPKTAIK